MAAKERLFKKIRKEKEQGYDDIPQGMRSSLKLKVMIFILTIIICSLFFTIHIDQKLNEAPDYSSVPGYIWPYQTIIAEYSFPVYKPRSQYRKEIDQAREKALKIFAFNENAEIQFPDRLEKITKDLPGLTVQSMDILNELYSEAALKPFLELEENARKSSLDNIVRVIKRYVKRMYKRGFINISRESIDNSEIAVYIPPSGETVYKTIDLIDPSDVLDNAGSYFKSRIPEDLQPLAAEILSKSMIPNLVFNEKLTQKEKELAGQSVPRTKGIVRKGDEIIKKGMMVSQDHIDKLRSYESSSFMRKDQMYSPWIYLGSLGHATLIYSIIIIYLFIMRKRIFYDNLHVSLISSILIFVAFQAWLTVQIISSFPIEMMIILPGLSILVAVVYDSRTAFYTTITMMLMLAGIRGSDYETSTAMLIAGMLAAYTVRDIQSRTQIYRSFFFIFLGFSIPILSFGLERSVEAITIIYRLGFALINSAISPLVTFGLLFIIERVTNIATDLRIKEYDNLNHPLLLKLSESAPGTYQHTLSLAILAERCASSINVDALLCRVGAYFHDIGKIVKPEYFGENQQDLDSKHDKITPRRSVDAIKAHVTNGIKLARQYKIPERIIDFIPMHHGTTLIKHFYAKAVEESEGAPVDEGDYRYPGPKPHTKEAAILMICDTAEALSRLMRNDKEKFEKALERNIEDKILDGQFDECEITFKEIGTVKETCIKNFLGATHKRVAYKELPKKKAEPDAKSDDG